MNQTDNHKPLETDSNSQYHKLRMQGASHDEAAGWCADDQAESMIAQMEHLLAGQDWERQQ